MKDVRYVSRAQLLCFPQLLTAFSRTMRTDIFDFAAAANLRALTAEPVNNLPGDSQHWNGQPATEGCRWCIFLATRSHKNAVLPRPFYRRWQVVLITFRLLYRPPFVVRAMRELLCSWGLDQSVVERFEGEFVNPFLQQVAVCIWSVFCYHRCYCQLVLTSCSYEWLS